MIKANITVGELAATLPGAPQVFESFGIDYCCGGHTTLAAACEAKAITIDSVIDKLTAAGENEEARKNFQDWNNHSLTSLLDHIEQNHHTFTKQELQRLPALFEKVINTHGARHPELSSVYRLFQLLSAELSVHLQKEEIVLFPYLRNLEKSSTNGGSVPQACFATVRNPVRVMMSEHDSAGDLLREIRALTEEYHAPQDACMSFSALFQALSALEQDLHKHIHLENNLVFPRALELEASVCGEKAVRSTVV